MKWLVLIVSTLLLLAAIWGGQFPLGVPGEWTWSRLEAPSPLALSLVIPIIVAASFTGFAWLGANRIDRAGGWETLAWLGGLVLAGIGWLWAVQEAAPQPHNLSKIAWVLFYPGSSGYFTEAQAIRDDRQYLANYEQVMSQGDVLHLGTHPPGLIVAYRGLMRLCDASPALVDLLNSALPDSFSEMFDILSQNARMGFRQPAATDRDAAVLWLAGLLVHGLAAFTILPLFFLLRRDHSPRTAWLVAALWPTVPAVAVFLPKSDTILPAFAFGFLTLWLHGCWSPAFRRPSPGELTSVPNDRLKAGLQPLLCFAAGFVLWLGMFISLALLPIAFLAVLLTVWDGWLCRAEDRIVNPARRLLIALTLASVGFLLPIAAIYAATGMNLFAVWAWNLHNHAGFYSQFPRTYWKWLLVNPVELSVAAGWPLVLLAIFANCRPRTEWRHRDSGPVWACLTTWLCLWISGKNMGEVARLWIVIMPCFVWLAARAFSSSVGWVEARDPPVKTRRRPFFSLSLILRVSGSVFSGGSRASTHPTNSTHPTLLWLVVLVLQFAVGLSIVLNVGGFDVPMPR
ncbi:MAG: hypothetical protein HZA46_05575 [Planctomycetales bacterium]|nr:hypothetical protein [Planctomycetales bacterium]